MKGIYFHSNMIFVKVFNDLKWVSWDRLMSIWSSSKEFSVCEFQTFEENV